MATQQIDGGRQIQNGTITNTQIAAAAGIKASQCAAWDQDTSANSHKLTNLAAPQNPGDAATMAYVDSVASGLDVKQSVRGASTAPVAGTYNATGGTSTRGQFTGMPTTIDSLTGGLAANDRVLLKDQAAGAQNGIWVVSTLGTGSNGIWDRATDFDTNAEVNAGAFTFVEEGTVNKGTGWVLSTPNPIIIGGASGTVLTFAQFSSSTALTAGAGMTQAGQAFNVIAGDASLLVNADELHVQLSGTTLATDGSGLKVNAGGITATQLATTVAGGGLDGGAGTALSVSWSGMETPTGTPNGILTDFTTAATPMAASGTDATAVAVWLDGVLQRPTTDYTRSGTTLSFTSAPFTGDQIRCMYFKA
jgi:hypothetical protein